MISLLISLTAGMIITRVAPEGRKGVSNMGAEIARQMTSEPKSWAIYWSPAANFLATSIATAPNCNRMRWTRLVQSSASNWQFCVS